MAIVSIGIAQSFLLAGNIEVCKRKQLALCGPAMVSAERLEAANSTHRTNIMVSANVAETVQTTVLNDFDFSVRPVALVRCKIRGEADDLHPGYAVLPVRIKQEKLKAWNLVFRELAVKIPNGAYTEALKAVEDYRAEHCVVDASKATKTAKAPPVDRTVEYYRRLLAVLIRGDLQKQGNLQTHASNFGV